MPVRHVPVLIAGAGPAGLAAALLLSWRGIPCLVAERHAATSRHPKAHGLNLRTMELLRAVPGVEDDLCQAARARPEDTTIVIAGSAAGHEIERLMLPGRFPARRLSAAVSPSTAQDRVEAVLLRHASRLGAEIRFLTELAEFSQDGSGAEATLRNAASGEISRWRAEYLIAADGAKSGIRQKLGIGMHGRRELAHAVSILFEADLAAVMKGRGFVLCYLRTPELTGAFVSDDTPDRGQLNVEYDARRESAADFTAERCAGIVRTALGLPDLAVKVLDVLPWEMSALLADRMSAGRIFLAGDAAHVMPPVGGLGAQTAIQDAANLAWKLALVLKGHASPALLETYEEERRPVARLTIARQTANYVERLHPGRKDLCPVPVPDNLEVALGYRCRSRAIVRGEGDGEAETENPFRPTAEAGARLPHLPLFREEREVSCQDLTGHGFVLFAAPGGSEWAQAARALAAESGLPLAAYRLGTDLGDPKDVFGTMCGIGRCGALLVRPDGVIAWRTPAAAADPGAVLRGVLARVLCRDEPLPSPLSA